MRFRGNSASFCHKRRAGRLRHAVVIRVSSRRIFPLTREKINPTFISQRFKRLNKTFAPGASHEISNAEAPLSRSHSPCSLFCFGLRFAACAQAGRGGISGLVTDPSGAIVPGAKVTAQNHGDRREALHGFDGSRLYSFVSLSPDLPGDRQRQGIRDHRCRRTSRSPSTRSQR